MTTDKNERLKLAIFRLLQRYEVMQMQASSVRDEVKADMCKNVINELVSALYASGLLGEYDDWLAKGGC